MSLRDAIESGNYQNYFTDESNQKKKKKTLREAIEDGTYQNYFEDDVPEESQKDKRIVEFLEGAKKIAKADEFKDGYQVGDISKTVLGTLTDLTQDAAAGILQPFESGIDIVANLIATGQTKLGFNEAANRTREFANQNLSANISEKIANATTPGVLYNIINGTPQKIFNPAEIEYDKNKNFIENYKEGFKKAYLTKSNEQEYEHSSASGEITDEIVSLIASNISKSGISKKMENLTGTKEIGNSKLGATINGGNIGITISGRTLNLPTFAFAGGMASGLQEANEKENISEIERWTKGISGGIIESTTEGLFGLLGVGGNELTDAWGEKAAQQFSSKAGKMLAKTGVSASGEAIEEFLSYAGNFLVDNGIIDKLGNADFKNEWNWGEVGEQMALAFVSSTLTSGGESLLQSNSAIQAAEEQLGRKLTSKEKADVTQASIEGTIQEKLNQINKYTDNENKVYEKLVNDKVNNELKNSTIEQEYSKRVDEQEKMLARDLTEQEKLQVQKEVEEAFDKNEISVESGIDSKKRKEIEKQVKEDLQNGKIDTKQIREILGENTDISKDTLLQNSYIQEQRKSQVYVYEKTESAPKNAVMESAVNANMNNTEISRNLINYVAKVSEDTGVAYRFVNNEQLKELGYSKENKIINGVVSKDGVVYLNSQSKEAINYVLGHETTHLLENTKEYTELQDLVLDYAKQTGIYEETMNSIKETYSDILETSEQFANELTSELTSRLLFTDENFVNQLSVKQPNVFQKIYDYIKHMIKMTTSGSEEAKQLEKIKYNFEKAYRQVNKQTNNKLKDKFSIQNNNGNKYVKIDTDQKVFDGIDKKDYNQIAKMYMQDYLKGKTILNENDNANIGRKGINKYTNPNQQTKYLSEKMQLTPELKNVLEIAEKVSEGTPTKDTAKFPNWEYYKFRFEIDGKQFEGLINIGVDKEGNKHFYEINKIHTTSNSYVSTNKSSSTDSIKNSITSQSEDVNTTTKYSMQESENNSKQKESKQDVFDKVIPQGNEYKVTAEDVAVTETKNNIEAEEPNIPISEKYQNEQEEKSRAKAVQYANRAKNRFTRKFTQDMKIDETVNKSIINDSLKQIETEIQQNGKLSKQRANEIFDYMYSNLQTKDGNYYLDTVDSSYEILDRENFDRNLEPLIQELKLADRYNKEELSSTTSIKDTETLKEVYNQISIKQKEYDKISNKEVLTKRDRAQVDRLINKEITIDELPADVNKKGIINVYNAKYELAELKKETQNYRKQVVSEYRNLAQKMTEDIRTWRDKKAGWKYQINTMKRNLRDIIPNKAEAQKMYDTYFKPITKNNAMIEKEINNYNERISKYEINNQESTYIQMIGEYTYNPESKISNEVIQEFYNKNEKKIDIDKCNKAVEEFRNIYNELFEKINTTLLKNGYKPVDYRKGYFPHFIEDKSESVVGKLAEKLGWKIKKDTLPTDIAGITDTFKPGKAWTSFSQQRTGDATDYNALKGYDNYIRGAMDVIYHTEDIQKLRALENEIRYQYSSDGIKEKINEIYANNELDIQEQQNQITEVLDNVKNSPMGNFVTELKNYTNNLANKKATGDRGMEEFWSRETYSVMSNIQNRVSANMVGANISSALTNFIPITQAWSQTSTKNLMRGIKESIAIQFKDDGFADNSTFLTNRTKNADRLYKTGLDTVNDKLGFIFDKVDEFTSNAIVRAKYYDNIEKGMSIQEAMSNADEFAKDVIAGRSKGDMPTVFNKKNPVAKLFTAFQLEVNNQYGYMFKDIPTDLGGEAKEKLVGAFVKMFLGAFFYNMLAEKITGRKSAFSPIDIAIDSYKTATNENLGLGEKVTSIGGDLIGEAPFLGGVAGGGRLPIQAALPSVSDTVSSVADLFDMNVENKTSAINTLKKELSKPLYYVALPFAGGQLKKTIEGLSMYNEDLPIAGSYTNSGKLRYTVSEDLGTKIKAGIFGQYSVKEAKEYFDEGYSPLTEKQTQELVELDIPMSDYRQYKNKLKEIDKIKQDEIDDDTSKLEMKLDYINGLELSNEQKNILANNTTTRKEKIDMSKYDEYSGLDEMDFAIKSPSEYKTIKTITNYETYNTYSNEIKDLKKKYSTDTQKKRAIVDYINDLPLNIEQKAVMIKLNYNSIDDNNPIIVNYINNLNIETKDKIEIFQKLGFTYKGGRLYD